MEDQGLPTRSDSVSDIDDLTDDSGGSLYTSCVNDRHCGDQKEQKLSPIDITDPCIPGVPTTKRTSTPKGNLSQPEVKSSPQETTFMSYTNEKERDMNGNFSHSCCAIDPDPCSEPVASSVCSGTTLDKIVRSLKTHLAEFQNSSNDSWTMREANFCFRSLKEIFDVMEKLDCFNQKYHTFVMNFDLHVLEILQLNVDSLLLSMKAFIRCANSLHISQHSGGVALYPEELIQVMTVLVEQSIRNVNTTWVTFLQQALADPFCECTENMEHFAAGLSSPSPPVLRNTPNQKCGKQCSPQGKDCTLMPQGTGDRPASLQPPFGMRECFVPLEKINERHFDAGTTFTTCSNQKCSDEEKKVLESNHSMCFGNSSPTTQEYVSTESKKTPLKQHTRTVSEEREKRKQKISKNKGNDKLSKKSLPRITRFDISPGHRSKSNKKRPVNQCDDNRLNSKDPERPQLPCTERGTQTPSRRQALKTSGDKRCSGPAVRSGSCIKEADKARRSKSSTCSSEERVDRNRKTPDSSKSQSLTDEGSQGKKDPIKSKKKLLPEFKDDVILLHKKEKVKGLGIQDHMGLTTFVSSVKSYKCSPTAVHVSLQVSCVERTVLAKKLSLKATTCKQLEKKKAKDKSRKRAREEKRADKSGTGERSMDSIERKSSSTPMKRLKCEYDTVIMKKFYDSLCEANTKTSHQCLEAERDDNNNTVEPQVRQGSARELSQKNRQCGEQAKYPKVGVNKTSPGNTSSLQDRASGLKKHTSSNLKGDNSQIKTIYTLLQDEDHFFLSQQAELTAKIKRMRKKKARGVAPGSSIPKVNRDMAGSGVRMTPCQVTDSNNNTVP